MAQAVAQSARINNHANLIWAIADLLRGDYKASEYQKVILPLVVLRRLDCVLEPTKRRVLERLRSATVTNVGPLMQAITGIEVYNTSPLTLKGVLADPAQVASHLRAWIADFDPETRDVIEKFDFGELSAIYSSEGRQAEEPEKERLSRIIGRAQRALRAPADHRRPAPVRPVRGVLAQRRAARRAGTRQRPGQLSPRLALEDLGVVVHAVDDGAHEGVGGPLVEEPVGPGADVQQ